MNADPDAAIRAALASIAPEADVDALGPDDDLQETLDLDSMDFLNFLIALARTTGVQIPETDYQLVRTYAGCRDYLVRQAAGPRDR
jgi:acyl carrier protein